MISRLLKLIRWNRVRDGFTLIETLVSIAIVAVLLGLMLPAIQRVREAGLRSRSTNNLRQIIVAIHHYAATNEQRLPLIVGNNDTPFYAGNSGTLLTEVLPFTDLGGAFISNLAHPVHIPLPVPFYLSPADHSVDRLLHNDALRWGHSSYAANAQVFRSGPRLPMTLPDGVSNTIAFAEHYSNCDFSFTYWTPGSFRSRGLGVHRATFADRSEYPFPNWKPIAGCDDVFPVTSAAMPPTTVGSVRGKTFQVAPRFEDCDGTVAQTPHVGGMLAAMTDGAVRTIKGDIANETYWALVTPAAGDLPVNDW